MKYLLIVIVFFTLLSAQENKAPSPHIVSPLAKKLLKQIKDFQFEKTSENFTPTMKKVLPPKALERMWKNHVKSAGAFKKMLGSRTEYSGKYTFIFLACKFEKGKYELRVVFDANKKIAGFFISLAADIEVIPLAKKFVNLLAKKKFVEASKKFDEKLKKFFTAAQLQKTWQALQKQIGKFQHQINVNSFVFQEYTIIRVTCEFTQKTYIVQVAYNKKKKIAGLQFLASKMPAYKSPKYVKRKAFSEQEITIGKGGKWELPGTLSIPVNRKSSPVVVLVHGSGPNDRDESIGPNKVFRDIAWGLASKGIAVLRYEKRTREHRLKLVSTANNLTLKEITTEDALLAVKLLRSKNFKGIDKNNIFVLGHSLGGTAIPRIALKDTKVKGFISLAGATRPLADIILEQVTYIASLKKLKNTKYIQKLKRQIAFLKSGKVTLKTPASKLPLNLGPKFWLDMHHYSPAQVAKRSKAPMLFLQGERDYQVTMEDFALWKKALSQRKNVEFKSYPGLNHLFIKGQGP